MVISGRTNWGLSDVIPQSERSGKLHIAATTDRAGQLGSLGIDELQMAILQEVLARETERKMFARFPGELVSRRTDERTRSAKRSVKVVLTSQPDPRAKSRRIDP